MPNWNLSSEATRLHSDALVWDMVVASGAWDPGLRKLHRFTDGIFLNDRNDASVDEMIRHIDHAVERIGPEHVGIGTDWFPATGLLHEMTTGNPSKYHHAEGSGYDAEIDFAPPEAWPELTEGLSKRGYAETQVRAILGENWLRVAREVWR
jgi:membrane dipeptidase